MPAGKNPNSLGNLKSFSDMPAEEHKALASKGGKASGAARRKKMQTKELIRLALSLTPQVDKKAEKMLETLGYNPDELGLPTSEMLAVLKILDNASKGDLPSLEMLYRYGLIPDMKAQIQREGLKIERDKQHGNTGETSSNNNMQTIAELINNPQPDIDIENINVDHTGAESDSN